MQVAAARGRLLTQSPHRPPRRRPAPLPPVRRHDGEDTGGEGGRKEEAAAGGGGRRGRWRREFPGYAVHLFDMHEHEDEAAEMRLTRDNIKAFMLDIFAAGTDMTIALE
ncbi:unnamed protein product [Urochloa humidicola]